MLNSKLESKIKSALRKKEGVIASYIVGSSIHGLVRKDSDFDLVVVVGDKRTLNEEKIYNLVKNIEFPKDLDLNVVDINSSPLFLFQVISDGKRIYEKNSKASVNFEVKVMKKFYDTQHIRNIYYSHLKKKYLDHAGR